MIRSAAIEQEVAGERCRLSNVLDDSYQGVRTRPADSQATR